MNLLLDTTVVLDGVFHRAPWVPEARGVQLLLIRAEERCDPIAPRRSVR